MQSSVQRMIEDHVSKLLAYLYQQTTPVYFKTSTSGPIVIRHVLRALQIDIFTTFAFSQAEATTFLDNLRSGPNTMEDLDMGILDLCHEDRRDAYFFWESEKPFKYFNRLVNRSGRLAHSKVSNLEESTSLSSVSSDLNRV